MNDILKKIKANSLITSAIYAVLGLVLLLKPELSANILCLAVGVVLVVCGAVYVILFLFNRDGSLYASSRLVMGIILAAVGVWIMLKPDLVTTIIPRIIGILICIHGVSDIGDAVTLHRNRYARWSAALILGLLTVVLGALLIWKPFDAYTTVVMLIGIFLLYDGISGIWITTRVSKTLRRVKKEAEAAAKAEAAAVDTDYQDVPTDPPADGAAPKSE